MQGAKAKTELDRMIEEFKEEGNARFLGKLGELDSLTATADPETHRKYYELDPDEMVDLGDLDIGKSHQSSWRARLVKRGRRNRKRRKEGLPPIYNTDDEESEDEKSGSGSDTDDAGSSSDKSDDR